MPTRRDQLAAADACLRDGLVVAVPTDTVYGLAVDPRRESAVEALFELKGRPAGLALPVLVADLAAALDLAAPGPAGEALGRLGERFWPGPLTIVVPLAPSRRLVLGGDGASVGLRCPRNELLLGLLEQAGPLAVTSANRHGEPPCTTAEAVRAVFGDEVAAVLDGGSCDGRPSTVVSLTASEPKLLRAGSVGLAELVEALADPVPSERRGAGARGARAEGPGAAGS